MLYIMSISNIVFYDDDLINIMEISKLSIPSILISNKPVDLNYKEKHNYHKNFVNNSYYDYFKSAGTPSQGFYMDHAKDLLAWIHKTDNPIVLFDWDRTITCFDGFSIENYPFSYSSNGIDPNDVIEYICGGYSRLNLLSFVFNAIRKEKGEIFIVTNNPISVHNRNEFIKLIKIIDPKFNDGCLLYGNGNKRLALLSCRYFMSLKKTIRK